MFIGEYIHTIDEKNRLSLPAKFRQLIGKRIVLTPGLDGCIFGFTINQWKAVSERLAESSMSSMLHSDTRSFNRFLFGGAVEAEIDSIGRILIPDFLRKKAGLGVGSGSKVVTKAVIIGVQNRIEIWNEELWSNYRQSVEKKADQLAEKLGDIGMI